MPRAGISWAKKAKLFGRKRNLTPNPSPRERELKLGLKYFKSTLKF
jgi:hypothetical protein